MFLLALVLLIVVPLAELFVFVEIAQRFGYPETILALLVISAVGGWIVWRQGIGVLTRIRDRVAFGQVPAVELVDGAMILAAGVLLLIPGFLTAIVGLALLVPPIRAVARRTGRRILARKASVVVVRRR